MPAPPSFTDAQARALIVAAERHGFERSPDRYVRWYDAELHDDAVDAAAFLRRVHRAELDAALVADDPLTAEQAARRIGAKGIALDVMDDVVGAATRRGFTCSVADLPLMPSIIEYDNGVLAIESLWRNDPEVLREILGEQMLLAPIPQTARWPCRCYPQDDAGYY